MKNRRDFFKSAATLGVLSATGFSLPAAEKTNEIKAFADDRPYWVFVLEKISRPVLENLSRHELKKQMPVEE